MGTRRFSTSRFCFRQKSKCAGNPIQSRARVVSLLRGLLGLGDDLDRDLPARVTSFYDGGHSVARGGDSGAWVSGFRFPGGGSDTDSSDEDGHGRHHLSSRNHHHSDVDRARDRGYSRRGTPNDADEAKVVKVAFGARHAVAVTLDGRMWAWGSNASGQLGFDEGPSGVLSPWPTPVDLEEDLESLDDEWSEEDGAVRVVSAAAGGQHTVLCDANGDVWVFGSGFGVGVPNAGAWVVPSRVWGLPPVVSVAAGTAHTAVVTAEGDVWTWWGPSRP